MSQHWVVPFKYTNGSGWDSNRDRFSNQCHRTDTNWQVNATKRACLSGRGYCPNAVHQPAGSLSCDIILQNISQIKSKYKDDWETIIGNCDSLVYLGGNDYSTFEYISKLLGKQTIRTKGQSIGKGSHGSSSDSYQVTGRELMTPDEVRRMKRSDCLVMISGEAPVRDKKYNLFDHPNLKYTPDYRSPRGLLHRFATPIPAPDGYTMPPDYMAQAGTVSLAYVAELTCPEITEDLYDELQEWEESLL